MAFDDDLVEVVGLGGVEGPQGEVVDDEQVDAGEPSELGVEGVVESRGAEPGEQFVGAVEPDGEAASDGDVAERGGQDASMSVKRSWAGSLRRRRRGCS